METIQIEISYKAWKKLKDYAFLRALLGTDSQTLSDLFLINVFAAVESGQSVVSIKAKED